VVKIDVYDDGMSDGWQGRLVMLSMCCWLEYVAPCHTTPTITITFVLATSSCRCPTRWDNCTSTATRLSPTRSAAKFSTFRVTAADMYVTLLQSVQNAVARFRLHLASSTPPRGVQRHRRRHKMRHGNRRRRDKNMEVWEGQNLTVIFLGKISALNRLNSQINMYKML